MRDRLARRPAMLIAACGVLLALTALHAHAQTCVPAPPGMIAWWPFDNSPNDIVGTNNPPSPTGAISYAAGKVGAGVDINLTPLGISILKTPKLNLLGSDFSIDAWVKLTKRGQGYIFMNYAGVPHYGLYITAQNKAAIGFRPGVAITGGNNDPRVEAIGNTTLNVGQWYHLVGVRSGATATQAGATASIYVNGKLDAPPVTNSAVLGVNKGSVDTGVYGCLYARIGGAVHTSTGHCTSPIPNPAESYWQFPGVIDEVEIFNRALTPAEIRDIYTKGKCKPLPADAKGMTWHVGGVNTTTGTVTVGCGNPPDRCDAYLGDRSCTDSLPLLCFKPSTPKLPAPKSVVEPDVYNRWSGGIIGTTSPVQASSFGGSLANANKRCEQEFGLGWRVAEFHDGWGWNFQAYGNVGDPKTRFWLHINDQPKGTCFPNP